MRCFAGQFTAAENGPKKLSEVIRAAPKCRQSEPSTHQRQNGEDDERHSHVFRRLMYVHMMLVEPLLSPKGQPHEAEHVERGQNSSEQADPIKKFAVVLVVERRKQDRVLREEPRKWREAGDGNRAGKHRVR